MTDDDLALLGGGAERSPKFQAEFELFAIFISLKVFTEVVNYPCQIFLRTDNVSALIAALDFKAKSPIMNQLAAEISLQIEALNLNLNGSHIAGLLNDTADKLSRGQVPLCCKAAVCLDTSQRSRSWFRAWPEHE